MNEKQARLAERRRGLVMLAAAQRLALAEGVERWRTPLKLFDRGLSALRFVKSHPAWIVGTAILPSALRPGLVGKWLRRGFVVLQVVNRLRGSAPR